MQMMLCLILSQRSLGFVHFFSFFSIYFSGDMISTLSFSGHLSILLTQLFCNWFLLEYCSFLFLFSLAHLNISYIFSILFPRSWIIFTINILNAFPEILLICTSFNCSWRVLSYSFIWDINLCIFILFSFLQLWFSLWTLQDCSSLASSVYSLVDGVI